MPKYYACCHFHFPFPQPHTYIHIHGHVHSQSRFLQTLPHCHIATLSLMYALLVIWDYSYLVYAASAGSSAVVGECVGERMCVRCAISCSYFANLYWLIKSR